MAMRGFVDEQVDQVSQGLKVAVDKLLGKLISLVKDQVSLVLGLDDEIKFLKDVLPKLNDVILNAEVTSEEMAKLRRGLKDFVEDAEDIVDEFDTELAQRNPSPIADRQRNRYLRRFIAWAGLLMGEQRSQTLVKLVCGCIPSSLCFHSCDHESVSLFFYAKIANQIKGLYGGLETLMNDRDKVRLFVDSAIKGLGMVREETQTEDVAGVLRRPIMDEVLRKDVLVGREEDTEEIMKLLLEPLSNPSVVLITGMGGIGKTTLVRTIFDVPDFDQRFQIKKWIGVGDKLNSKAVMREIFGTEKRGEVLPELRGKRFLIVLDDCWSGKLSSWDDLWDPLSHGVGGSKVVITSREDVSKELEGVSVKPYALGFLSEEECLRIFESYAFPNGVPSSSSGFDNTKKLRKIGREIAEKKIRGVPLAARVLGSSLRNETREVIWNNVLNIVSNEITSALMWSYRRLPSYLKKCFAFWSLLRKDYELYKKHMIWMWMAWGSVHPEKNLKLEDIGESYLDNLVGASLIQHIYSFKGMEFYAMHDLVHDLAIDVSGNGRLIPSNEVATENFSFVLEHLDTKKLRMLVVCSLEDTRILEYQLRYVRILVYKSDQPITTVEFAEMIHLRYLDLSHVNTNTMPEAVCGIYNLQTLILHDRVKNFPLGTWKLPNLRHLVGGTYIKMAGIGNSRSLQTVSNFNVSDRHDIEELGNLKELRGKLRINVQIAQGPDDQMQNGILEDLPLHENLSGLEIDGYMGYRFPSWMGGKQLLNIVKLTLSDLGNLLELPPLGQLPQLEYLCIKYSKNIQRIGNEFYGTEADVFPSLKELYLESMHVLEEWKECNYSRRGRISIWFPSLEVLDITFCKELRSLPRLPRHLKKLVICQTGLRVLPEVLTYRSNDPDKYVLLYMEELNISDCPFLYPDKWFRKHQMPSLYSLVLHRVPRCTDLILYFSRKCLRDLAVQYMFGLREITLSNLIPMEEFKEADHQNLFITLDGLYVLDHMSIVNREDGKKITAGPLFLRALRCNPALVLQGKGQEFMLDEECTIENVVDLKTDKWEFLLKVDPRTLVNLWLDEWDFDREVSRHDQRRLARWFQNLSSLQNLKIWGSKINSWPPYMSWKDPCSQTSIETLHCWMDHDKNKFPVFEEINSPSLKEEASKHYLQFLSTLYEEGE